MKSRIQAGNDGRVPAPPEKRFPINSRMLAIIAAMGLFSLYPLLAADPPEDTKPSREAKGKPPSEATNPASSPASRPSSAATTWLPKDAAGWTVFKPDTKGLIMYVSSSAGDDATGKACSPNDPAVGNNPFLPAGAVKPFKTIAAALKNAREGQPDWVLLKKGDEWKEDLGTLPNGRDNTAPFLMSAYGDAPARPVLRVGGYNVFR